MGPAEYISEGSDESRLCLVMVCVNRVLINPDPHQLDLEIDGKNISKTIVQYVWKVQVQVLLKVFSGLNKVVPKHKGDSEICWESISPSPPGRGFSPGKGSFLWLEQPRCDWYTKYINYYFIILKKFILQ